MHAATDELCAGELESWGHASHTPVNVYLPAPHSAHGPPSRPAKPALQTHAVAAVLPAGDVLEAGHPPHATLPAVSLYVPAPHSAHEPPSGPEKPALHKQVIDVLTYVNLMMIFSSITVAQPFSLTLKLSSGAYPTLNT